MEAIQLATLVKEMRDSQKNYFKDRTRSALLNSKRLESEVDAAVAAVLSPIQPSNQNQLF